MTLKLSATLWLVLFSLGSLQLRAQAAHGKPIMPAERHCMNNIIRLDDSLGRFRNLQCLVDPLSKTILDYTSALQKLDFSQCPEAFRSAFHRHAKAWNDLLPIVGSYPDLRGEMHTLFKELEQSRDSVSFRTRVKTVWDTWAEIEVFVK